MTLRENNTLFIRRNQSDFGDVLEEEYEVLCFETGDKLSSQVGGDFPVVISTETSTGTTLSELTYGTPLRGI